MDCIFCPTTEMIEDPEFDLGMVRCCNNCKTNFFFDSNLQLKIWYFETIYKEHKYYIDWRLDTLEISRVVIDIEKIMSGKYGRRVITIFPNQKIDQKLLTPYNILQKLPTILTFL